jgi:hypothetical protein
VERNMARMEKMLAEFPSRKKENTIKMSLKEI